MYLDSVLAQYNMQAQQILFEWFYRNLKGCPDSFLYIYLASTNDSISFGINLMDILLGVIHISVCFFKQTWWVVGFWASGWVRFQLNFVCFKKSTRKTWATLYLYEKQST